MTYGTPYKIRADFTAWAACTGCLPYDNGFNKYKVTSGTALGRYDTLQGVGLSVNPALVEPSGPCEWGYEGPAGVTVGLWHFTNAGFATCAGTPDVIYDQIAVYIERDDNGLGGKIWSIRALLYTSATVSGLPTVLTVIFNGQPGSTVYISPPTSDCRDYTFTEGIDTNYTTGNKCPGIPLPTDYTEAAPFSGTTIPMMSFF